MKYLTEDDTLFNDEHDAIEYETYFKGYSEKLLEFIETQKTVVFTDRDRVQIARYLFNLIENEEFDWNQ